MTEEQDTPPRPRRIARWLVRGLPFTGAIWIVWALGTSPLVVLSGPATYLRLAAGAALFLVLTLMPLTAIYLSAVERWVVRRREPPEA